MQLGLRHPYQLGDKALQLGHFQLQPFVTKTLAVVRINNVAEVYPDSSVHYD
jgi:hypothetical protein